MFGAQVPAFAPTGDEANVRHLDLHRVLTGGPNEPERAVIERYLAVRTQAANDGSVGETFSFCAFGTL